MGLLRGLRYLEECKKGCFTSAGIADSVYDFLGAIGYKEFLSIYSNTASLALSAFATNKKLRKEMLEVLGEEYFDYFCSILHGIIELCNDINTSEVNMAVLDQVRWRKCNYQIETLDKLEKVKLIYECKLKCLK